MDGVINTISKDLTEEDAEGGQIIVAEHIFLWDEVYLPYCRKFLPPPPRLMEPGG